MNLVNLQNSFAHALLTGENKDSLNAHFAEYSASEHAFRLQIYRNNIFYSLTDVLRDTYSTINALVGDTFFDALAHAYFKQEPPQNPTMIALGESFAHFIADFEHTQSLPYLADCAKLDWARHSAYHAEEATSLTAEAFANIAPAALIKHTFKAHPSSTLLRSRYAIFTIWDAIDNNKTTKTINYDSQESVLVVRPDATVNSYLLTPDMGTFIQAVLNEKTLKDAIDEASAHSPKFNTPEAVAFLISSGLTVKTHRLT